MWADPMPDEDQLARLYDGNYFERRNGGPDDGHLLVGYHDYVGLRFLKQMDDQRVAGSLMDMAPPPDVQACWTSGAQWGTSWTPHRIVGST